MNPAELAEIIKKDIGNVLSKTTTKLQSKGIVVKVADGVAIVHGLEDAHIGSVVQFECAAETKGLVLNLEKHSVGIVNMGKDSDISEGDSVTIYSNNAEVPCGNGMLGRVVDALGRPIDGKGELGSDETGNDICYRHIEESAPSITDRKSISEPMYTGIKAIDSMIPIGRGQRELIIGDRQTGKTSIAVSTIMNQKNINDKLEDSKQHMHCIYVAIGQKMSSIAKMIKKLSTHGAMKYTTIVIASAADPAPMQFLAPYTGCAIGEHFRDNGMHALVIYDDLSKHAVAYRQMSLLLRRPPGREAYPGDVFFIHSRLLERAAKMSDEKGGGSLTALPIIETSAGDVSAYIPTNVISITDGQIFLEADLFYKGIRPAINVGISVSRVSSAAQNKATKKVSGRIKLDLAQYREIESFSQFASDLDESTKKLLDRGKKLTEMFKQNNNITFTMEEEVVVLFVGTNGYLDDIPLNMVSDFLDFTVKIMHNDHVAVMNEIYDKNDLDDELQQRLHEIMADAVANYKKRNIDK